MYLINSAWVSTIHQAVGNRHCRHNGRQGKGEYVLTEPIFCLKRGRDK